MITLRIPRELKSPNAWLWRHWRVKQRERNDWEKAIAWALVGVTATREGRAFVYGAMTRRKVTVERVVPSKRNFIRDADNTMFSVKLLNDALKKCGLLFDDSREWLEQPMPTQVVGPDFETVIVIEKAEQSC